MSVLREGLITNCMLSSHLLSSYQLPVTTPVHNVLHIKTDILHTQKHIYSAILKHMYVFAYSLCAM